MNGRQRSRRSRPVRSASVAVRLLVLVLVPLLGLFALGADGASHRAYTARSAAVVHTSVGRIARLVDVRSELFQERIFSEWVASIEAWGVISVPEATAFTGYDIGQLQREAKARVDVAVSALGVDGAVLTASDLAAARARTGEITPADMTAAQPATMTAAYEPIERRLDEAKNRITVELEPELDLPGGNRIATELAVVRAEMDIARSLVAQLKATELLFVKGDDDQLIFDVVAARTTQDRAYEELRHLGDPAADLRTSPAAEQFRAGMDAMIGGDYPRFSVGPPDWPRLALLNTTGVDHATGVFGQIQRSTSAAGEMATNLERDATHELRLWTAGVVAAALVTLGLSLLLTRSITRPLRRLRGHAEALSGGDVQVEPLPGDGPSDIAVTSQAFNDLVDNLRLLEAKTQALADLDFEAEALTRALPGALGQSLQRSMRALSGSISERDQLRGHIIHQASHDELTGLPNRSAAIEELDQALTRARRVGRGVGVLLVDVDDFKRMNDMHGHRFGDQLLVDVSRRLDRAAEGSSLVARVGGDEFLVLLEDVDGPDSVTELAREVAAALGRPVLIDTHVTQMTVGVGVAFSWDGSDDPQQLLAGADLAVARAKVRAPGSVEFHDRALQAQLVAQAALEDALVAALRTDDELFLQYQPVVDPTSGAMAGVEALVRWNRPGMGVQPPDSFIPVAERSNLVIELDRWVLARAARQIEEWSDHPQLGHTSVAVNVSGRHLVSQTLFDHVSSMLELTGIDPGRLVIELTETALVADLVVAAAQLEAIRRLGVRIALDDFGTGYTSIAHLRQLPVDIIKIDRSFVSRLASPTDRALLRMIIELGHQLGTSITAEGVETVEQYEVLRELGCDRVQGFLLSRPVVPEVLVGWAIAREAVPAPAAAETYTS